MTDHILNLSLLSDCYAIKAIAERNIEILTKEIGVEIIEQHMEKESAKLFENNDHSNN